MLAADLLANGQLPNTKTTLFTATAPTIIKSMTFVNTDVGALTMNVYLKRTTSRRIAPVALSVAAGAAYIDDTTRTLAIGDILEGDASTAAKIDYTICGAAG